MNYKWQKIKIDDISNINVSSYSKKDDWDFVNYLDTGNITNNQIDKIQRIDLKNEKLPSRAKRKVKNNSIIYSTVRPNQCHFGILKNQPQNFLVSTGFAVIDVDESIADSDFIYYYLTQSNIIEGLHSIAEQSVSAYPSIKPSDIADLVLLLPSLEIQKRVSNILCSLDDKIELNNQINKNLEQQAQAIFKEMFTNCMDSGILMNQIIDVRDGTHDSPKRQENGYYLITSKHLLPYSVNKKEANLISENDYLKINERSKVERGDILISMIGTVGIISFVSDENIDFAIKNVGLLKTSQKKSVCFYVLNYLKSNEVVNYIEQHLAGTTQKYISLNELRNLPINIPTDKILEKYNFVIKPLYEKIILNYKENEILSSLRDSLLPKLMSGEIDVSKIEL